MNILLNLALFQIGWVITVAGAGAGYWWTGSPGLAGVTGFATGPRR